MAEENGCIASCMYLLHRVARFFCYIVIGLSVFFISSTLNAQQTISSSILPKHPTKPWVFWYWMQAAVSKEGIKADLEAMKQNGIAGAYLMPIKGATNPPIINPPAQQLSPVFWDMVRYAMQEADRLGLQLGMHFSDGFAIGGGPWITPELSMQKVVWSKTYIKGGKHLSIPLPKPNSYTSYYRDIAVYAIPVRKEYEQSSSLLHPIVTTSTGIDAGFLTNENNKESFKSEDGCWIQYQFKTPFTCRSITIRTNGNNYQAQRLWILKSDDGKSFDTITRLQSPRHGWQDTDADHTYAVAAFTARYLRFVYDKNGSEPGAEDLDAAKWKPVLKLNGIEVSSAPVIHLFESKNGEMWRVAPATNGCQLRDSDCVPLQHIVQLKKYMDSTGQLVWRAPPGHWLILRMGSTSTGHTNATGGGGMGLECDKFNPVAIEMQFNQWFKEVIHQTGEALASRVLKVFHVDSWECGSQNWSPVFAEEFSKRRGYDLLPYLPVLAGIPISNGIASEQILHDVRQTISELIADKFYATLSRLSHTNGCVFTAESVAPTMVSDGMLYYKNVDVPMGEYWLNSPTHDKPNDMLDAISAAHIYGKKIIQAEAFTTLRMNWNETPAILKTLQDRNYAAGINRLVYHVFVHNPWLNRKPGMTLDGIGLYFQRDQTWWRQGKAWVEYAERCQSLLQKGSPVVDIAVFTGEELPSRSILPDRLLPTIPNIFGTERVLSEKARLANLQQPIAEKPKGVRYVANTFRAEDWLDPLNGYKYDCINADALLRLATVLNGKIVLPGGASYKLLIIPASHPMNPDAGLMSLAVLKKIKEFAAQGATIIFAEQPTHVPGYTNAMEDAKILQALAKELWQNNAYAHLYKGVYMDGDFNKLGLNKDVEVKEVGKAAQGIEWTHRQEAARHIYFLSNQLEKQRDLTISLRAAGTSVSLYDAVSDRLMPCKSYQKEGRTIIHMSMVPNGSVFIFVQAKKVNIPPSNTAVAVKRVTVVDAPWTIQFDTAYGGPSHPVLIDSLQDWTTFSDSSIRYYSGTALYSSSFPYNGTLSKAGVWLQLGTVKDIATVKVNGMNCGTVWTYPYAVDISKAVHTGKNTLQITVANTWANRLAKDQTLPVGKRITNTNAVIRLSINLLNAAGLLGPVELIKGE